MSHLNRRSFLSLTGLVAGASILPEPPALVPESLPLEESESPLIFRHAMSLFESNIAPGEVALFSFIPQRVFRPDRLIIPSSVVDYLEFLDCDAQGQAILARTVPAWVFSEVAYSQSANIAFPILMPGVQIDFALLNTSDRMLERVGLAVVGTSVR